MIKQNSYPHIESATCQFETSSGFLVLDGVEGEVWVEGYPRLNFWPATCRFQVLVVNFDFLCMRHHWNLKGSKHDDEEMDQRWTGQQNNTHSNNAVPGLADGQIPLPRKLRFDFCETCPPKTTGKVLNAHK